MLNTILKKIDHNKELAVSEIIEILNLHSNSDLEHLFSKARSIKYSVTGNNVFLRGLIELSNICSRDCYYCGIRKSNSNFTRFMLTKEDAIECAKFAYKNKFASLVIQSGERQDKNFIDFIEDLLIEIRNRTENKLRVTLSLGEQSEKTYKRWHNAGAHRYLLRIETTNKKIYNTIHPINYSYDERVECLRVLREVGYQLGTGVMIGLPGQTIEDLAHDIIFFKDIGVDMIGMGPYIPHHDTPLWKNLKKPFLKFEAEKQVLLGLKMIAATRLFLKDINIASTTALQTLDPNYGLEKGLLAGANVIMPNLTDFKYKQSYKLYDNKPCLDDTPEVMLSKLNSRIVKIGENIAFGKWGDSVHFITR